MRRDGAEGRDRQRGAGGGRSSDPTRSAGVLDRRRLSGKQPPGGAASAVNWMRGATSEKTLCGAPKQKLRLLGGMWLPDLGQSDLGASKRRTSAGRSGAASPPTVEVIGYESGISLSVDHIRHAGSASRRRSLTSRADASWPAATRTPAWSLAPIVTRKAADGRYFWSNRDRAVWKASGGRDVRAELRPSPGCLVFWRWLVGQLRRSRRSSSSLVTDVALGSPRKPRCSSDFIIELPRRRTRRSWPKRDVPILAQGAGRRSSRSQRSQAGDVRVHSSG